jgi:hypothetical protein
MQRQDVRGGGDPPVACVPKDRMGPLPRSLAADAHGCIMVRVSRMDLLEHSPNIRLWRDDRPPMAGSPQIVLTMLRPTAAAQLIVLDRRTPTKD